MPSFLFPYPFAVPHTLIMYQYHRELVLSLDLALVSAVIFILPSCHCSLSCALVEFHSKMTATSLSYKISNTVDRT